MDTTKRTPAKINLCLLVGPKNETGNHEVFTVFVPVDVCDELEFTLEAHPGDGGPGRLHVECRAAAGEANLATQALRALERHTGWGLSGRVVIHKGIPVGAGLGGGSSDAAAALLAGARALAEAGGPEPERAELVALARELGADVAFFLDAVPSIGRGIGEILEPLDLPEFSLVLVLSERHLATARVYGAYDAAMPFENRAVFEYRATEAEKRWHQVTEVAHVASLLENDLEKTSFSIIPNLVTDREILVREGAVAALMSGSGPTLFGLCSSRAGAEALADKMTIRGFKTHVVTVGRGVA